MTIQESDRQSDRLSEIPDTQGVISKPVDLQFNKLQRAYDNAVIRQETGTRWTKLADRIVRFFNGMC